MLRYLVRLVEVKCLAGSKQLFQWLGSGSMLPYPAICARRK
jgi:hypothetical protein